MNTDHPAAKEPADPTAALAFVSKDTPASPGVLRQTCEDFVVHEVPAYPPDGQGEHLLVHIEKRDLTTKEAVRRLCLALGADPREASWAGMKDRRAVTRQWVSLEGVTPEAALALNDTFEADEAARAVEGRDTLSRLRVLDAGRHSQKLRTGHLRGNRFELRVRMTPEDMADADVVANVQRVLDRLNEVGLPNYFGAQRFGRHFDNAIVARRWATGEQRAPRDRFKRKLYASALQSEVFNAFVHSRVVDGTLGRVAPGELVKKHESGGMFTVPPTDADVAEAQARADAWELSPTGPMFGKKMRKANDEARAREERCLAENGLTMEDFARLGRSGQGTRRLIRVRPADAGVTRQEDGYSVSFSLPKGSYATVLMREIMKRSPSFAPLGQ